MSETKIGYVKYSINPYEWYCEPKSTGCKNCYMFALAGQYNRPDPLVGFSTRWDKALREVAKVQPGETVFLNDMSDTYLARASDTDVLRCHWLAVDNPDVYFIIVTKRPERAYFMRERLPWPDNLWLCVSVEDEDNLWRVDYALATGAKHVAISAEPLLGPLPDLYPYLWPALNMKPRPGCPRVPNERRVEWVIVGGESGVNRRTLALAAVRQLRDMCDDARVPFFYKQGSHRFPGRDRELDGRIYSEIPEAFGGQGKGRYLKLHTTRVSKWSTDECAARGIVYLDVTYKSGDDYTPESLRQIGGSGEHFAPSQKLLVDYKGWYNTPGVSDAEYTRRFTDQMRASLLANWNSWKWLLRQSEVALSCYCAAGEFCHRHLLVDLLIKAGAKYGVDVQYAGELAPPAKPQQLSLFDLAPQEEPAAPVVYE